VISSGSSRPWFALVGIFLVTLAALSSRMLLGARAEVRLADEAKGDKEAEARHLRRAMANYSPGNPWVREAATRLWRLALEAEARGQTDEALDALHQLRSAILSLRGSTRPFAELLPEVNRHLAELQAAHPRAAVKLRTTQGRSELLRRLNHPPEPHPLWAALGLIGFALWVSGAFATIYFSLRPDVSIISRRFFPLVGVIALGLVLFCLGLAYA
jgi:hypothetical protein